MAEVSPDAGDSNESPDSAPMTPHADASASGPVSTQPTPERESPGNRGNAEDSQEEFGEGTEEEDGGDDEDEDGEGDDEDDDEEEPQLKYARLTQHLSALYRNGDATSAFLVAGDKMVNSNTCLFLVRNC